MLIIYSESDSDLDSKVADLLLVMVELRNVITTFTITCDICVCLITGIFKAMLPTEMGVELMLPNDKVLNHHFLFVVLNVFAAILEVGPSQM